MEACLRRREFVKGALAASLLLWIDQEPELKANLPRLRPGAQLELSCTGAEAFLLESLAGRQLIPARAGRALCAAPQALPLGWSQLRCTPLRGDQRWGRPLEIPILSLSPSFGA